MAELIAKIMLDPDNILLEALSNASQKGNPWEKIKTIEDACQHLGEDNQLVKAYRSVESVEDAQFKAYVQLRVIAEALNTFDKQNKEDEDMGTQYAPSFRVFMKYEIERMDYLEQLNLRIISLKNHNCKFSDAIGYNGVVRVLNSFENPQPVSLNTEELAKYCGKRFIGLFRDYRYKMKQS